VFRFSARTAESSDDPKCSPDPLWAPRSLLLFDYQGRFHRAYSGRDVKLTIYLCLVLRLRTSGSVGLVSHMHSWRAQVQNYLNRSSRLSSFCQQMNNIIVTKLP